MRIAAIHEAQNSTPSLPKAPKGYNSISNWQSDYTAMDNHNNFEGADLGKCQPDSFDCTKAAKDLLKKGKLKVNVKGGYSF